MAVSPCPFSRWQPASDPVDPRYVGELKGHGEAKFGLAKAGEVRAQPGGPAVPFAYVHLFHHGSLSHIVPLYVDERKWRDHGAAEKAMGISALALECCWRVTRPIFSS